MPRSIVSRLASVFAFLTAVFVLAPDVARCDETLPSGEEVINKYVDAIGGRAELEKVTSRVVHGSVSVPAQNITGKVTVYQKAPGMLVEVVEIPGVGTERRGFDSTTGLGWSSSDMAGARIVKGDELDRLRQEADPQAEVNWKNLFTDAKTTGIEKVGGSDCYKVEMTTKAGKLETRYYDKGTGLLTRSVTELEMPQGKIGADATISDYRDVGGLKIAFSNSTKLSVSGIQLVQNVKLEKVEPNVDIPADKFAVPDDVKKLAEKQKAGAEPAGGEKAK